MADRHRLGTFINGRFTAALDLAPANGTWAVERDTFTITPPVQSDIKVKNARRYGGARRVGEIHDNGNLTAQWFIKGANLQASLAQLDTLLAILESSSTAYFWEWRPDGATYSVYFEVRGTSWEPLYRWVQTAGTGHLHVKLGVDVAPLALGDQLDITDDFSSITATAAVGNKITNGSVETDLAGWTLNNVNRTNRITNPSFEYDTLGAAPFGWGSSSFLTTTAVQNGWANTGTKSLRLTGSVTNNDRSIFSAAITGLSAGDTLSVQAILNILAGTTATGTPPQIIIQWDTGANTWTNGSATVGSLPNWNTGVRTMSGSAVAPAGTTQARLRIIGNTSGAGSQTIDMYLDSVMAIRAATLPAYFDGDTAGCSWSGTAGQSQSTQPIGTLTRDNAWASVGTWSARFTANPVSPEASPTVDTPIFAVTAGGQVSGKLAVHATTITGGTVPLTVHWPDGSSSAAFATISGAGDSTASFAGLTAPATGNATIRLAPSAAGTYDVSVDAVIVIDGAVVPTGYVDTSVAYTGGLLTDYSWDTGTDTLVDYAGALTPVDTSEKRLYHSARGYLFTDAQVTLKVTPGASVAATHSTGVILRRVDASNFLWASVDDTNALRIFKRVAGVDTQLATAAFTPTANTAFWVGLRAEGNVITAEAWNAEPTFSGTPAVSLTYALTPSEAVTLGAAVAGAAGARLIPKAVDWTYDDFRVAPYTYKNRALPEVLDLRGIPGTAPARFDLGLGQPASNPRIEPWGLVGWAPRPAAHNLVWNGDFDDAALGTTGWSVAATDLTWGCTSFNRVTSSAKYGLASGQAVTPAAHVDEGPTFRLYRRFRKGVTYTATAWVWSATSTQPVSIQMGDSTDSGAAVSVNLSPAPQQITATWTPTADKDTCVVAINTNNAVAITFNIDGVQVFEGTVAPTVGKHGEGKGGYPPFGILQAEAAIPSTLAGWTIGSGGTLGGYSLGLGSGTAASAEWFVDPTLLAADDFGAEITVDVYARVATAAAAVSANAALSAIPENNAGQRIPVNEWGTAGKNLVIPASGAAAWRLVKLGTITFPVDPANPSRWRLKLALAAAVASEIDLDYLLLVPARQRALGPTAKANDSSYPALFHAAGVEELKTIRSDLAGRYSQPPGAAGRDGGLNGQLLELAPGDNRVLLKLSDIVPDDPTSSTYAEAGVTVTAGAHFAVQPRYLLTRTS